MVSSLLTALAWLFARLGPASLRRVGRMLGWFACQVLRIRRAHVLMALRRANVAAPERVAQQMFEGLGCSAAEALAVAGGRGPQEFASLDAAARARLSDPNAEPFIGLVSHTANWELSLLVASALRPVACVVKRIRHQGIDDFCTKLRTRGDVALLREEEVLRSATEALGRGRTVIFPMDQVPPAMARRWPRAQTLGAMAYVDTSPFVLAARLGLPVVVFAQRRDADGRSLVSVLGSFVPPQRGRAAWARSAAVQATSCLEAFVRENPAAWLWLHRRWRAPLPAMAPSPHALRLA